MKTSDFNFDLPPSLLATHPIQERSESRLMRLDRKQEQISHHTFTDILEFFKPGDLLVLNNTKVIKARLYGQKASGGKVETLFHQLVDPHHAWMQIKSSKALKVGTRLLIHPQGELIVKEKKDQLYLIESDLSISDLLEQSGHIPLPPYFKRAATEEDHHRYQTVYAKSQGAIAAPTAGLHFTPSLLQNLKNKGIEIGELTLHVGAGTFQPIHREDYKNHRLHHERCIVDQTLCDQWMQAKQRGSKIIAVGTTSTRALESAMQDGVLTPYHDESNLFIYPGYTFKAIDGMITNFHLPKSSLLMMISALANWPFIKKAYEEAIHHQYRFYSYGDAMLIL